MNILIITYYYPPCNSIASLRPYSWAKNWSKLNHNVTVVTRNWSSEDKNWNDFLNSSQSQKTNIEQLENYKLVQIPYKKKKSSNRFLRKIDTTKNILSGNFNFEIDAEQFRASCENEITANKPDFILVTAPPLNLIKLGHQLSKKYKVKFATDFRDYENFSTLKINPTTSIWRKLDVHLKNKYLKKWLAEAITISVASEEFASYFNKKNITQKAREFTNGFESEIFDYSENTQKNDEFSIAILGTILPNQDSLCFLKGFNSFLKENPNAKIKIDFIGGGAIKEVADLWSKNITTAKLNITPRIDRNLALQIGKNADILFYPGWKGYKGMYSGKIFDYIGLKRNILIAPNDYNVIERLVKKTQSGKVVNNSTEVKDQLTNWYHVWVEKGEIPYIGIEAEIIKYTRENIATSLLKEIEKSIHDK